MRVSRSVVADAIAGELAAAVERIAPDADARDARQAFFDAKLAIFAGVAHAWSQRQSAVDADAAARHYRAAGILDDLSAERMLSAAASLDVTAVGTEFDSGDLSSLYQQVLQSDLSWQAGRYRVTTSKASRDSSGAYYTPPALAWEVTRHSLDELIRARTGIPAYSSLAATPHQRATVDELLATVRIADLSCGGGDFLLAALEYARRFSGVAPLVAGNLWGVDVDPIALILASAEIEHRMPGAVPHLVLGNPLLAATESSTPGTKAALFATGRIYAPGMALDPATYPAGFDLILGNPPWEKIRFEERKTRELLGNAAHVSPLVGDLTRDYAEARALIGDNALLGHAPRGEANTYALFPLLGVGLLTPEAGVMALILKSAIATSPVNSGLFSWLRTDGGLRELHLFENTSRIFAIDSRERFCIGLFASGSSPSLAVSFGNTTVAPLEKLPAVTVSDAELWAMHPATGTLPSVRSTSDFADLQSICARLPRFAQRHPDATFGRIVHLTSHADSISEAPGPDRLPILEGKFIGPYTTRAATFDGIAHAKRYTPKAHARRLTFDERRRSAPEARYFIDAARWRDLSKKFDRDFMLCWRSLTSATNARTTIAAIAPFGPAVQSVQFLQLPDDRELAFLLGLFNSMAFDHLVRAMIPGIDLTQSVIRQVPVPAAETLDRQVTFAGSSARLEQHIVSRVERLLRHDPDTVAFVDGPDAVPDPLSERGHLDLIAQIDELFFLAYELDGAAVERVRAGFRPAVTRQR